VPVKVGRKQGQTQPRGMSPSTDFCCTTVMLGWSIDAITLLLRQFEPVSLAKGANFVKKNTTTANFGGIDRWSGAQC